MRLPMHITGILENSTILNKMDGMLFKTLGYEVARELNGRVESFIPPTYPLNYFRLVINLNNQPISILLHEYFPLIAFANYENMLHIHFLNNQDLFNKWKPYYTVLELEFLNQPFIQRDHDLSDIELQNANYWRPSTIGEVIFNCWD